MRPTVVAVLLAFALPSLTLAQTPTPKHQPAALGNVVQKAVDDPARAADRDIDARRKIGQIMVFAEVKPGQKVLELMPGTGYFTRVFSAIVGPQGHVYTVWPDEAAKFSAKSFAALSEVAKEPHYANISLLKQPAANVSAPEAVNLVFTSQNYHDYLNPSMGPVDMVKFDREVFAALKPGGLFVVIDHVAPAGSGATDTNTLHRVDPALVKKQVEEAGFVFDGESHALSNPKDPHDIKVFDPAIRGHTDQFMYRFRKPAQ
ncbi:MAG: methyltransferase [Rhodanobacter sp.]